MQELWQPVPGWQDLYEASTYGRIRFIPKQRILKPAKKWNGRLTVHLPRRSGTGSSRQQVMLVHRLVALAWLPNPDHLPEINHIDGDPTNNCLSNLEWCTHSQNHKHRFQVLKINNLSSGKLTPQQRSLIRVSTGSASQAARRFGVSPSRVIQLRKGLD